jgi:hypothetical protein
MVWLLHDGVLVSGDAGPGQSRVVQRRLYWSASDVSRHANSDAIRDLLAGGTPTVTPLDIDADLLRPELGIFPAEAPCAAIGDP